MVTEAAREAARTASPEGAVELASARGWLRGWNALRRRLRWLFHFARWRWRFGAFGWTSILQRPLLLTGASSIELGRGVEIRAGARLEALATRTGGRALLRIGDGTTIHPGFHCGAAGRVEIGRDVLIAGRVYVTDHDHDLGAPGRPPGRSERLHVAPTRIGDDCWLGEGSMVLKGVELGRGCIVAAGAVVTRSVPDYTLVAGVPARPLRRWDASRGAWVRVDGSGS